MSPISSRIGGGYIINGFERGTVSDLNDPEKLNRVKVRITDKDIETPFADVVSPMAGKNYGSVCIPQKGEEVLVGFCDGDISNPVVLGSLYNSANKPPIKIDANKNEIMVIKLSTGLTIEINTNKNKSNLSIKTQKGHLIDIEDNSKQEVFLKEKAGKTSFKVNFSEGKIELKADKEISMAAGTGGASLSINSTRGLEIKTKTGNVNITAKNVAIKSTANFTATANGNNTIKSTGKTTVQSSGFTIVKGAMVKIN